MIVCIELSKNLIEEYKECASLDNGAVADYLKYGNLIVELEEYNNEEYEKLIFSIHFDARPYNINVETVCRKNLNNYSALIHNTENNSLCILGEDEYEVLCDFLFEHGKFIEFGDFNPIEDDDWY